MLGASLTAARYRHFADAYVIKSHNLDKLKRAVEALLPPKQATQGDVLELAKQRRRTDPPV